MTDSVTEPAALRGDSRRAALDERNVDADPFRQFARWFDEAGAAGIRDPNAMVLASAGPGGQPSARVVLLKGVDARGFVFYTNYASRKARELAPDAPAALLFFWPGLERQIRIEGIVERVGGPESDAYFATRPRESQLGAWASPQSSPIPDRGWLDTSYAECAARFDGRVPRPPHWGGIRVLPSRFEFWQGRASRLHDRLVWTRTDGGWTLGRLAP
ncbi:MAG: pyridoxamine 5'-phosphate oxidase [Proteobacteria bacterium]|nr:pyridoxamine 5'-phosphate oxidase [Pseudomonadota bacterium]